MHRASIPASEARLRSSWAQLRLTGRVPWGKDVLAPYTALLGVQPEALPTFPAPAETCAFPVLHFSFGSAVENLGVPWVRSVRCVWCGFGGTSG